MAGSYSQVSIGLIADQATFHGPANFEGGHTFINSATFEDEKLPIHFNIQDPIESFTGRHSFLSILHSRIQEQGLTVLSQMKIIKGLGGVGKTETARKYIAKYADCYENFIWINADSDDTMTNSFLELAETKLKIPIPPQGKVPNIKQILDKIYTKLCTRKTLLIFDNVDTENPRGNRGKSIKKFLPSSILPPLIRPFILLTSRNQEWGSLSSKVLPLDVFTDEESIEFILTQLDLADNPNPQYKELARDLGELLGGLPLALQQAVAYIRESILETNILDGGNFNPILNYIQTFKKEEVKRKLLTYDHEEMDRYTWTVYTTWNVSMKKIKEYYQGGEEAIKIIQVLALLYSENIPAQLLSTIFENSSGDGSQTLDLQNFDLGPGLRLLNTYSMIKLHVDQVTSNNSTSIHRQVQQVIRETLKESQIVAPILDNLLPICDKYVRNLQVGHLTFRTILNNLLALINNFPLLPMTNQLMIYQANWAMHFDKIGNYDRAHNLIEQALKTKREILKMSEREMTITRNNMALILSHQGKLEESLGIYKKVYEDQKKLYPENHPLTLTTLENITAVLLQQSKYDEGTPLAEDLVQRYKEKVGPSHQDTIGAMINLSSFYLNQHKYGEALQVLDTALELRHACADSEKDPLTFRILSNKALVFEGQGKELEALELFKKVYKMRKQLLGPQHPDTLRTKGNMAALMKGPENEEKVLEIQQQVLDVASSVMGTKQPFTLISMSNKGATLLGQGRTTEALDLFKKVETAQTQRLSPSHPDLIKTQINIARTLKKESKFKEALEILEKIREIQMNSLKKGDPSLIETESNMATTLAAMERWAEALNIFELVKEKQCKLLGEEHKSTLQTKHNVAAALGELGKWEEALAVLLNVWDIRRKNPKTKDFQMSSELLELILMELNLKGESQKLYKLQDEASQLLEKRDFREALNVQREVYNILKVRVGVGHPESVVTMYKIAHLTSLVGQRQEAMVLWRRVCDLMESVLGSQNEQALDCWRKLKELERCQRSQKGPASSTADGLAHTASCDDCGMNPIQGTQFKCNLCPDFDLCQNCWEKGEHEHSEFSEIKLRS